MSSATFYEKEQFSGNSQTYTADIHDISKDIGGGAMSCKITGKKHWTVFAGKGLSGDHQSLGPGEYSTYAAMGMHGTGAMSARLEATK